MKRRGQVRAEGHRRALPAMQRVVEFGEYGVAAYALRCPEQRQYFAYAKAFHGAAVDYWEVTHCFAKFASDGGHGSPGAAIDNVLQVALMSLINIGCVRPDGRDDSPSPEGAA